jgi:hypothetical protein
VPIGTVLAVGGVALVPYVTFTTCGKLPLELWSSVTISLARIDFLTLWSSSIPGSCLPGAEKLCCVVSLSPKIFFITASLILLTWNWELYKC